MSFYQNHYQRLRPALFALMTHGTHIDQAGAKALAKDFEARKSQIKQELDALTGGIRLYVYSQHLNPEYIRVRRAKALFKGKAEKASRAILAFQQKSMEDEGLKYVYEVGTGLSDDKIKHYLYTRLGLPKKTKRNKETGKPALTVDDGTLKKLAVAYPIHRPLIALILEHRKCTKMLGYVDDEKLDEDSRLRCSWKPAGTQTGRLASSENPLGTGMNQQNIPSHDSYGQKVKSLFLPDEGCLFLKLDLSMAEARNFWWQTGDPQLRELAMSKPWESDIYRQLAAMILAKPEAEITKEERQVCGKKISLGSHYGMQEARMSDSLAKEGYFFSAGQCKSLQDRYFAALPGIPRHHARVVEWAIREHTTHGIIRLTNSFGRQIEFRTKDGAERLDMKLYHRLFAWPSQADIGDHNNQLGLIPFWEEKARLGWKSMPNAVVHDEVLVSVLPEEAWDIAQFLRASLEQPYEVAGAPLSIPVTVSLGRHWADGNCEWKRFPSKDEFIAKVEELGNA